MTGEISHRNTQLSPVADTEPGSQLVVRDECVEEATVSRSEFGEIAAGVQKRGSLLGEAWTTLTQRYDIEVHHQAGLMTPDGETWYKQNYANKPFPVRFKQSPEPSLFGSWSVKERQDVDLLVVNSLGAWLREIDKQIALYGGDLHTAVRESIGTSAMRIGESKLTIWRTVVNQYNAT